MKYPQAVEDAIVHMSKLPGVGRKTAQRLVQHLLKMGTHDVTQFAACIAALKTDVGFCPVCFHIKEINAAHCDVCQDVTRDQTRVCVVEDFIDVFAIEQTASFRGVYHVLHGVLSPVDGVGPGELTIDALVDRLAKGGVQELIFATNPTMEGEATAMFIKKRLPADTTIQMSRIAKGMPVGANIDYADEVTLSNALAKRVAF